MHAATVLNLEPLWAWRCRWQSPAQGARGTARGHHPEARSTDAPTSSVLQCPRIVYTDVNGLICKITEEPPHQKRWSERFIVHQQELLTH